MYCLASLTSFASHFIENSLAKTGLSVRLAFFTLIALQNEKISARNAVTFRELI